MKRRPLLLSLLAATAVPGAIPAHAATPGRSATDPLRVGVENALVTSGLASQLIQSFSRDTGVQARLVPGTSAGVLSALEQGDVDVSMTNVPELELKLEKTGLAHDRQAVARSDFVLVGAVAGKGRKAKDPLGLGGGRDIAAALAAIAAGQGRFVAPPDGSAANLTELAMWRAAKVAPAAPWYVKTPATGDAIAAAAAQGGYTLVERGVWLQRGRAPLAVLVEGDPLLANDVHVMRAFRVKHPAAKLFVQWVAGGNGRRVAGSVRGWQGARK